MFDRLGRLTGPLDASPHAFRALAGFYRRLLCDDLLPWWRRHAMDRAYGGLCSCIRDDGRIVATEKYVWSQVRALWTFSAACRRIADRAEWRDEADALFRFVTRHAQRPDGRWNFLLGRDGRVKEGPASIQTDAYAICALVEYARLSGCDEALEAARRTYRAAIECLRRPGSYRTRPYPIPPGAKAHRVSMQFSLAFTELGKQTGEADVLDEGRRLTDDVLDHFRRPERRAHVEYLALDNTMLPPPVGTYMSPGHGIETAWFQVENLRGSDEPARVAKALEIMRWAFERGWDPEYGGLFLGLDLEGGTPYLPNAETKIWWPHCEGLCGFLMAFEATRDPEWLEVYRQVHDWSFAHFPDRRHGEWTQRLDRAGRPIETVVALPVKDPFHLPRAAIYAVEVCERLAADGAR